MNKQDELRNRWLHIRLTEKEYEYVNSQFKKTVSRKLSDYTRKMIISKPHILKYRNLSADDFLEEMIGLKNELNAIGKNINQETKKLHLLVNYPDIKTWLFINEAIFKLLFAKIDKIESRLHEIHALWSQK